MHAEKLSIQRRRATVVFLSRQTRRAGDIDFFKEQRPVLCELNLRYVQTNIYKQNESLTVDFSDVKARKNVIITEKSQRDNDTLLAIIETLIDDKKGLLDCI